MLKVNLSAKHACLIAAVLLAGLLAMPAAAVAQVVVVVNGAPVTELDIAQRGKLMESATHKKPTRQEVINELIDDRIKIAKAKTYGFDLPQTEVDAAFEGMAKRQGITAQQFAQYLDHSGITANAVKARIRAELTWQQLVRGKYSSTLQIGESDINSALRSRGEDTKDAVGYVYTLYPVVIIVPAGSGDTVLEAKRREADNLRGRFQSCAEGLALARAVRDVAVRDPITRNSADLTPQIRDLLGNVEVGHLTTPDVTPQGLQMFALCEKKQSATDSPVKREMREKIFTSRFDSEAKKFLEELRKQAMIEYK